MTYTILVLIFILSTSMFSYYLGRRYGGSETDSITLREESARINELNELIEGDDYKKMMEGYGEVLIVINEHLDVQSPISKAAQELFARQIEGEIGRAHV